MKGAFENGMPNMEEGMMKQFLALLVLFVVAGLAAPPGAVAGEAFIKGGYVAYVDEDDTGPDLSLNSLIFSGGTDWKMFDYFSLGPEIQYSWKSVEIPGEVDKEKFHFFNLYANAKFHLGNDQIRRLVFNLCQRGFSVKRFDGRESLFL